MNAEKAAKVLRWIYAGCIAQFIAFIILTNVFNFLNQKLLILLSAVFGIVVAHLARNVIWDYIVDRSSKPLDEFVKDVIDSSKKD